MTSRPRTLLLVLAMAIAVSPPWRCIHAGGDHAREGDGGRGPSPHVHHHTHGDASHAHHHHHRHSHREGAAEESDHRHGLLDQVVDEVKIVWTAPRPSEVDRGPLAAPAPLAFAASSRLDWRPHPRCRPPPGSAHVIGVPDLIRTVILLV